MIYLTMEEYRAVQLGLGRIIEDLTKPKMDMYPWTPEVRKFKKEIVTAANTAAAKIEKVTGVKAELPEYEEGDEDEFLTKQS